MTWSILARDPGTGLTGIAIASRFFAVGALCPWTQGNLGVACTQALMNPMLGPRSLALLREGLKPADIINILISGDEGRNQRQLHLMDNTGQSAAHTGSDCIGWCGHKSAPGVSVAGNMLAGGAVVAETLTAFVEAADLPIVERLLLAMRAGESAGGDKRGRQSCALIIQGPEPYPRLSLRVDDHDDPLGEMERLYDVAKQRFIPFSLAFPDLDHPYGLLDRNDIDGLIERYGRQPLGAKNFKMTSEDKS